MTRTSGATRRTGEWAAPLERPRLPRLLLPRTYGLLRRCAVQTKFLVAGSLLLLVVIFTLRNVEVVSICFVLRTLGDMCHQENQVDGRYGSGKVGDRNE